MKIPFDKSAYLICGEDEFRVAMATRELLDALVPEAERDVGLETIDGDVGNVDDTIGMIRSVRAALASDSLFFGGARTVWLRDPAFLTVDRVAKSEDVKGELSGLIAHMGECLGNGLRLVVSTTKVNRGSSFYKAFSGDNAFVADFGSGLKPKQKIVAADELVAEFCKRIGIKMATDVRQLFIARAGTDSRQLVLELEKLKCYCGEAAEATADDIRAIVSPGAVPEFWELIDAFSTRNARALAAQVRSQLAQGENAIRMVNSLLSTVGDLIAIREGRERGWAAPRAGGLDWSTLPADIADGLNHSEKSVFSATGFPLRKKIDQSASWTVRELRAARHYLLELRELLVSCSLPKEFLVQTKLLQAIGTKRPAPQAARGPGK